MKPAPQRIQEREQELNDARQRVESLELAAGATDEDLDRDGVRGIATRLDDIEDTQQEILDRLERLEE